MDIYNKKLTDLTKKELVTLIEENYDLLLKSKWTQQLTASSLTIIVYQNELMRKEYLKVN